MKPKNYLFMLCLISLSATAQNSNPYWSINGNKGLGSQNYLGHKNFNDIRIITDNKVRMFVSALGKVGIGTKTPDHLLHVSADTVSTSLGVTSNKRSSFLVIGKGATDESAVLSFRNKANLMWQTGMMNDNNFTIRNNSNGTKALLIDVSNSNVAIGSGNADYRLSVSGYDTLGKNRYAGIKLENTAQGGNPWYITAGAAGNSQGAHSLAIADDSTFWFKIDKKGRVSIGSGTNYNTLGHTLQVGRTTGSGIGIGTSESIADAGNNWLTVDASWTPKQDNINTLGSASNRWKRVFAANGVINTSDLRDKSNVEPIKYGTAALMKLNPVSYTWKTGDDKDVKLGLIAQELQVIIPEVVVDKDIVYNEETKATEVVPTERLGVYYSDLIPVLIKGFQEQVAVNNQLADENKSLKQQLDQVVQRLNTMETALTQCCTNFEQSQTKTSDNSQVKQAQLLQNEPNPFGQNTVIKYYLPSDSKGILKIMDLNGSVLKSYTLNKSGYGEVIINGRELSQGTYSYSLYVNDKLIDNKLMILTR